MSTVPAPLRAFSKVLANRYRCQEQGREDRRSKWENLRAGFPDDGKADIALFFIA